MEPAEVAQMVIAAIRDEQFLILTHDSYPTELLARVRGAGRHAACPTCPSSRDAATAPDRFQAVVAMPPSTGMTAPVR